MSGTREGVHYQKGPLESHTNAALTPRARLKVAQLVVDQAVPVSEVAARFQCSWPTAKRWADRYRASESMQDHFLTSSQLTEAGLRRRPLPESSGCGCGKTRSSLEPSTVHQILSAARLNRLSHVDRATGESVRRYEHDRSGSLIHVDVKKLGNIPIGGGWRYVGGQQGDRNRQVTPTGKNKHRQSLLRHAFVHAVIDDHSRLAYAEVHDDGTALTATAVLTKVVAWFKAWGIAIERVLSDNGSAYKSHLWHQTCQKLGITPKKTRPLPAPDQRQDRTIPQDHDQRLGLRPLPHLRTTTTRHPHQLDPLLQSPSPPPSTCLANLPGQYNSSGSETTTAQGCGS